MHKTKIYECNNKLTVDIVELQAMLSVGKNTAADIGEKAGAVVRVGRRKLFNVSKIQRYIDDLAEV